ncbi:MAG: hypothetical protein ACYDD6_02695 [Acidimicrobiales bacterium]
MQPPQPVDPAEPPEDPEDWTDEQWLDWLQATDGDHPGSGGSGRVTARWRDRPGGQLLGAAMLGLRDAIYGRPDDQVVIVVEASGDPPDDDLPVVHLDPDHPERSEVVVRSRRTGRRRSPGV